MTLPCCSDCNGEGNTLPSSFDANGRRRQQAQRCARLFLLFLFTDATWQGNGGVGQTLPTCFRPITIPSHSTRMTVTTNYDNEDQRQHQRGPMTTMTNEDDNADK